MISMDARHGMGRFSSLQRPQGGDGAACTPFADSTPGPHTPEGRTDLANAMRLKEDYGHVLRYCHPWRKWLEYDGRRWKVDDTGAPKRYAEDCATKQWANIAKAQGKVDPALVDHATTSCSARGINNALSLAESLPGIAILPSALNSHPFLLNCENGTLDLKTGELRPHLAQDYLTHLVPTKYDPDASSDVWFRFLQSIIPDEDTQTFLQRAMGYALTGDTREQVAFFFYGGGSNGKSTFVNAIKDTMGPDLAIKLDPRVIVATNSMSHGTERMDNFGKRAAFCSETEEGQRLAEASLKDMTGQEAQRGRRMREDSWEFVPTAKIFLSTNHKPEIGGGDFAIWRRIRLVPFTQRFTRPEDPAGDPSRRIDPKLGEKLAAIKPAILAWAVRGCADWLENGLPASKEVVAATNEYRNDQDRLAGFIDECCLVQPSVRVKSSSLYSCYAKWSEANGEQALTQAKFSKRLKEHDRIRFERSNGSWFIGIAIRENAGDFT